MITTHVLDIGKGRPASRVPVELDVFISGHGWREVGRGISNDEGRILGFGEPTAVGVYRLMFDVASYDADVFFPSIAVMFEIRDAEEEFHIQLLLSGYGYTVCRGKL